MTLRRRRSALIGRKPWSRCAVFPPRSS